MGNTTSAGVVWQQPVRRVNFFNKLELEELPNVLMSGEEVLGVISGMYTAGTAILCVTTKRLLLIDKKLIRLNFEDIRFEAISEVNYSSQLMLASVQFFFGGRVLKFRSWYRHELRELAQFVQNKMFEARSTRGTYVDLDGKPGQSLQYNQTPSSYEFNTPNLVQSESPVVDQSVPPRLETFLKGRTQRWNRADRLHDTIASIKLGRPVLTIALRH